VAEQVRDYLVSGIVRNAVNLPSVSAEDLPMLRPFVMLGEKLGLFQGQVARGGVAEIDVEYAGEIAERNVQPVTLAVLRGILAPWVGDEVNFVNAPLVAQKHGVRVIETKSAAPEDYVSLLTVKVRSRGGQSHLVAGTIFGRTQPRIVRVDDFRFEAIPEGPTFLIRNQDRPGVVGRMGTLLGSAGINIKRMQLGLHLSSGEALQLLSVEPMPSAQILEAVRKLENVETALLLDLGARVT
jgi:D-3-phosphoglycerate dehydrogenase / 2-oxoglutarate reductase